MKMMYNFRTTQTWKSWKIMEPIMEKHGATSGTMVNRGTTKGNIEGHEADHGESWNNFVEQTQIMEQLWKSWKIMEQLRRAWKIMNRSWGDHTTRHGEHTETPGTIEERIETLGRDHG